MNNFAWPFRAHLRAFGLLLFLLTLLDSSADAQGNFWTFSNGPYGGTAANEVLISPKGLVFAASAGDLFRSSDSGTTWTHLFHLGYPEAFYSVAMNSKGHLFVGDAANVIDFSSDDGSTWSQLHMPGTQFTNVIYIANDVLYASNGNGIYTSPDEGKTWNSYIEGTPRDNVVGFAALGTGIAAMHTTLDITSFEGHSNLLLTTDQGKTWDSISLAYPSLMKHVGSDGVILYAADDSNVFRYDPVQKTFNKHPFSRISIGEFQVLNNGFLYAAFYDSSSARDSFVYSRDKGQTFQPFGPGGEIIRTIVAGNGGLYLGTFSDGVLRSTDNGATWASGPYGLSSDVYNVISGDGPTLLASGYGGGMISHDNGASWQQMKGVARHIVHMTRASNGHILAWTPNSTSGQIDYIEIKDNGATAIKLSHPYPLNFRKLLYLDWNGALYDWSDAIDTVFFRSTDEGQNWTPIKFPRAYSPVLSFVTKQNHLFVNTYTKPYLRRSTDLGQTWQGISSVTEDTAYITPLAEGANGVLYAKGKRRDLQEEFYRSMDDGLNWVKTADRFATGTVSGVITGGDTVYATSFGPDSTILRSIDNGLTWELLTSGLLPNSQVYDIAMRPEGSVFAATNFGVYRHPPLPNSRVSTVRAGGIACMLYPNPTNSNCTLEFNLSKQSSILVTICNLLGEVVQTPFEGSLGIGEHTLPLHLQSLRAGSYFCRISEEGTEQTVLLVITR